MVPRFLLSTTILASFAAVWSWSPASAGDQSSVPPYPYDPSLPAVSKLNARLEGAFGEFDDKNMAAFQGSLATPLGHSYGAQIDVPAGGWDGRSLVGAAGHLFWRDPAFALIGLYGIGYHSDATRELVFDPNTGATTNITGFDLGRIGLEAHLYRGPFTVQARAGWEVSTTTSRFFDEVDLVYYAFPELRLAAGHRYVGGLNAAAFSAEYQALRGVGVFAEGLVGEQSFQAVIGGVRIYFDTDKSLIRRDREDILPGDLPSDLFALSRAMTRTSLPVSTAPPPPPCLNCGP